MFDARIRPLIDPILNAQGARLAARGVRPDQVTLAGLGFGLLAALLIALGAMGWALAAIVLSRLADGLDGAVARAGQPSDFGGFLDIVCDFAFYGAVPLAFVVVDPANGLAAAFLLFSFYVNGATFLAYAVLAEKREMKTDALGVKTLYFTGGLLEGAETIGLFVLFCLLPGWFVPAAFVFGALCLVTAVSRVLLAARVF
ncbi:Inner membrane protein YnjF [Tritonibacter multivorans]|uniref:Inner membrane protein YnjF n=1 Tax=Tritonibacter multivorans TaxID=928856 RepID=A0A0N7LYI3_9RHOB|nr:CDP-alcohol phosphatidyltransferase family protein [Tritonibacter multivorans]MDA7422436.1 CDP-alcohol phosphatidyltransferase family protein [Tritonibacter multivorans]CUH74945.1 Inner membrane protein YnjF [Tritonibacter multivorans]SFD44062.1 Phosphatidylglycerophosphate synthase [Tritonibacter multivorans]